jgi:PAS domain S-box-containing protein
MTPTADQEMTREQLVAELEALRARLVTLERTESGSVFRSLVESAPDAMVIINERGEIVLVNSQTEKLFGYRPCEMIGQPVELLVPDRFRAGHVAQRNAFLADPSPRPMGAHLELFGRRKGGEEFPVEISLAPLMTEEGLWVTSTLRDATERRQAEARLRRAEARYRSLVEEIPAVTFVASFDDSNKELYVSPQIESLLGFTQKEWLEDPVLWFRQLHPDDRERWNTEFAPTVAAGNPFSSVYRFVARDGRVVWVRGEAQVVKDDDGRPLFLQGIAFDITAIKQAEEELRLLNQTLEERVRERTALAEERNKALTRANANLIEFGRIAVHDLGQPLRTVQSFSGKLEKLFFGNQFESLGLPANGIELQQQLHTYDAALAKQKLWQAGELVKSVVQAGMKAGFDADIATWSGPAILLAVEETNAFEARVRLERIINAGQRMEELLKSLSEYSRTGKGKPFSQVECDDVFVATCADLHTTIEESGAEVTAGNLPRVWGDGTQLRQLLQNLIGNALKFRAERPPVVRIEAQTQDDDWLFCVRDNGIGIKAEYLQKVFILGSESRVHAGIPGSGIGLNTCEKIVQRHQGRIWADSPGPDQGTTIKFTLPMRPSAPA